MHVGTSGLPRPTSSAAPEKSFAMEYSTPATGLIS